MTIYEVNLNIDKSIYSEFALWLTEHVQEMLQFQGFMQASIFKQELEEGSEQEKVTVQYQLRRREDLEKYFIESAPRMREEGLKRFEDKFSATRRIFERQGTILK